MSRFSILGCICIILLALLTGCGGGGTTGVLDSVSNDDHVRAASSTDPSYWSDGLGGNGSRTRSLDPDWIGTSNIFRGPRTNDLMWSTATGGDFPHAGCRNFAIGTDNKIYFHEDQDHWACLNPDGTEDTGMNVAFTCDNPSDRFDSSPVMLYDGEVCHIEPRVDGLNNTCYVAVYGTEGADKGVLLDDFEIGGNIANSPATCPDDFNTIFVTSRHDPDNRSYLYSLTWNSSYQTLTQAWAKMLTTANNQQVSPPTYWDNPDPLLLDRIAMLRYQPATPSIPGCLWLIDTNENPSGSIGTLLTLVLENGEVPNLDSLVVDNDRRYYFTTNYRLISSVGGMAWEYRMDTHDSITPPSIPSVMHNGPNGDETVFITYGTTNGSTYYGKLVGIQTVAGAMTVVFDVDLEDEVHHCSGCDDIGVIIDAENKIYVSCVNSICCYDPWPGGTPLTNMERVWRYTGFTDPSQLFTPAIGPNGSVYIMSSESPMTLTVNCFGPGLPEDDRYEPLWNQWGHSDPLHHWNQRKGDSNMPIYTSRFNYTWTSLLTNCGIPYGTPATAGVAGTGFDQEAVWVADKYGTINRVTWDGVNTPVNDYSYMPVFSNTILVPGFTSPSVSPDGGVVYGQGTDNYSRLDYGATTDTWMTPSGIWSNRLTSPCMVRDTNYGGYVYYTAETVFNGYKLKCTQDDGTVVWEHTAYSLGTLEGTACYVSREDTKTGETHDTIFVQTTDYTNAPMYWNVWGYDAHTGVLVYQSGLLQGANPLPASFSMEERSVVFDGDNTLFMVSESYLNALSIPNRGAGVTTLPTLWTQATGMTDSCGLSYDSGILYFMGEYTGYNYIRAIDVNTQTIVWTSNVVWDIYEAARPIIDQAGNLYVTTDYTVDIYNRNISTSPINTFFVPSLNLNYRVRGSCSFGNKGVYVPVYDVNLNRGELLYFTVL